MVAEFAPAPLNSTYLRVQHIGDPGTPELAGEVSNTVTWNVGAVTGLSLDPSVFAHAQRGYRDAGPPVATSAFQLWCNAAGFWINSRQFSHLTPLTLEGPSASVARDLSPPATVFRNGTSALTIDASVAVPVVQHDAPPIIDGTAQVSFFYYARDTTTGTSFAHVIALFDNRAAGVNGAGGEAISADAYTAFVVSPLAPVTAGGNPVRYVSVGATSAVTQFVLPWVTPRHFRAHVSYDSFRAMLLDLRSGSLPAISDRPQDYVITSFGLLGEVFPGLGSGHEVALGASVTDLKLSEAYADIGAVPVVEYYHAGLDHYFSSARAEDIEALDSGRLSGWMRTGRMFGAYPTFMAGAAPVCRFYLPPDYGDSHFLSASTQECALVAAKFPGFTLEDAAVMYMVLPDPDDGSCAPGTAPVFRLWNGRTDSNHRYVTEFAVRALMVNAGWIAEGYGPTAVAMCAPQT